MAVNAPILNAVDTISGGEAECYMVANGKRTWLMNATKATATYKKNKNPIRVLGSRTSRHKNNGGEGTGTMSFFYNSSAFRKMMQDYKESGVDTYFEMYITNNDSTSSVGRQTTRLEGVNLDSIIVAMFDVDQDGALVEDVPFTFDDWYLMEEFAEIDRMV